MKGKILAIVMVICLAFPVLTIAATNLLTNAGFETGDFTGWTIGGNAEHHGVAVDGTKILESSFPDNNFVNVNTGSYAAWATVSATSDPPVYLELEQTLTVLPNSTYDVGFWLSVRLSGFGGIGSTYYIAVDGTEILSEPLKTIDSSYLHESAEYTTGPSQNSATVTFHLTGSGIAAVGFSYDDFHFNGEVPPTYTVTYDANGATSGTAPADQTKIYNVTLTLANNSGGLARTGYTFSGWNTAADGSGTDYAEGATYTANAAVTLYAQWADARPMAIPALSEWGVILFSLLMAATAVIFMRKRNKMAA